MSCKLIYDKFCGDHAFKNEITSQVSVADLDDGSFEFYVGKNALKEYNKRFLGNFKLPEFLLQSKMYQLNFYSKIIDGLETFYTIVEINTDLLEKYVREKQPIPEVGFFKNLCRYHAAYSNKNLTVTNIEFSELYTLDSKIKNNIKYIVDKASTAVDYTNDIRINDPKELNLKLYEFQKSSIHWMLEKEKNPTVLRYNLHEENIMNGVYFDLYDQTFNLIEDREALTFYGGALIDEVGLGKTIQCISVALLNPPKKTEYISNIDTTKLHSRATLVICPNQLCGQWSREIKSKVKKEYNVNVVQFLTKRDHDKYTYQDILDADFVIVSFTFLDNKVFTTPWRSKISSAASFTRKLWTASQKEVVTDTFKNMGEQLVLDPLESMDKKNPLLQLVYWNRIVIDEFHEVYSNSKYMYLRNLVPHFKGNFTWAVTATPFINNDSLYHTMEYLLKFKNNHGDKLLVFEQFVDYLGTNCFRGNTKKSVDEIEQFKLPPIKEEILWLKFTATERMMYNAYLADANNNHFDVYLRKLCCHPQLADETKMALSNCKTLAEMEKMMVSHYKNEMDIAAEKVQKIKDRIVQIHLNIQKFTRKQKMYQLKRLRRKFDKNYDSDDSDDEDGVDEEVEFNSDPAIDESLDMEIALIISKNKHKKNISKLLTIEPTVTMDNFEESLEKAQLKLKEAIGVLEGKKATCNFFNNVIERLKKTAASDNKEKIRNDKIELSGKSLMDYYENLSDSDSEDDDEETCGICLGEIADDDIGVTTCGHIFCYECLKITVNKYHNCPYCKNKLTNNQIYVLSYQRAKKASNMSKDDEELINEIGTKLANLIFYLRDTKEHVIIFSQWDGLLRRVGRILATNGIKNVFCKGNCYQRDKAIREFNEDRGIKVIMLSSEQSASGTNLTKASKVILLEPIYGEYKYRKDQEKQAIGRAHRMGQMNTVTVIRLLIKDSIEDEIHTLNVCEDKKHK